MIEAKEWKTKVPEITNALKDRPLNLQTVRDKKKKDMYLKVILVLLVTNYYNLHYRLY